ncbi:MAG: molybdate ABC transporter permease subunit [Eubacteriales bacterium]|jgi:molybdate transport system permease protein
MDLHPLILTLQVAALGTLLSFFTGIAAAWGVMRLRRGRGLVDGLLTLPMVLPPTVVGFFLLMVFGKNSPLGQLLNLLGQSVIFSWRGAVAAAWVMAFPLMYRTVRGSMEQLDGDILHAARTLGMGEWQVFRRVALPNLLPGIVAGVVLAFARSMGEFGATIMLAGNIAGKTRTMAVAVYTAVQAGDYGLAYRWAVVICLLSMGCMLLLNLWNGWYARRKGRREGF